METIVPDHLIIDILCFLPTIQDRFKAGLTCRQWYFCVQQPKIWKHVILSFVNNSDDELTQLALTKNYGHKMTCVRLETNQSERESRKNSLKILQLLTEAQNERVYPAFLCDFHIAFTGENPLFYAGQEFNIALVNLFTVQPCSLTTVDLHLLPILFWPNLFEALSRHNNLRYLDVQNKTLISKIEPDCLLNLVRNCPCLEDLRVLHFSMCSNILVELSLGHRAMLRHLSILTRRQDKYVEEGLSDEAWYLLLAASPQLEVTLKFDHTCPLWKVREVMKPNIPVANLFLETYTQVYEELSIATDCYAHCIRKLVIQSQPSEELDHALISLAESAKKLESLHVMCTLDKETIDRILNLHPGIAISGDYTLKNLSEPHPWVGDEVLDEISLHWK